MGGDFRFQLSHRLPYLSRYGIRDILLVGEVELRLDQRTRTRQALSPSVIKSRKIACTLFNRQTTLHLRFSLKQVGQTFDFKKVHLAILEGSARKLPGLRGTYIREPLELSKN